MMVVMLSYYLLLDLGVGMVLKNLINRQTEVTYKVAPLFKLKIIL